MVAATISLARWRQPEVRKRRWPAAAIALVGVWAGLAAPAAGRVVLNEVLGQGEQTLTTWDALRARGLHVATGLERFACDRIRDSHLA